MLSLSQVFILETLDGRGGGSLGETSQLNMLLCQSANNFAYHCTVTINPPTTTSVNISLNVDILANVYLVHLITLSNPSTFTGQNELTVFHR